jgi:hypothetical protein
MEKIDELLECNRQGLIPGPGEEADAFWKRAAETKRRFAGGEWIPGAHWDWARAMLREAYDVDPVWVAACYSDEGLAPWQGAACWIEGREVRAVQLREGLRKGSYLGICRREEVLAHEAVHVARCAFDERRSEEFFAYAVSLRKWRKVLGPMIQRPWEVWPFFGSAVGFAFCSCAAPFWERGEEAALGCLWMGICWIGLGFWRLIGQHRRLKLAGGALLKEMGDARKARAILLRLTDAEIGCFAKGEKVRAYAERQRCLRWEAIRTAYFK